MSATQPIVFPDAYQHGRALKSALLDAGVRLYEAAEVLGVSRGTISRKVSGKSTIYVEDLLAVSRLTGTDPGSIIEDAFTIAERDAGLVAVG